MTTLIAAYNSEGCIGRCDARCYNATCGTCDCICGGANHGVGLKQAIDNTADYADKMLEAYGLENPYERADVLPKTPQRMLL